MNKKRPVRNESTVRWFASKGALIGAVMKDFAARKYEPQGTAVPREVVYRVRKPESDKGVPVREFKSSIAMMRAIEREAAEMGRGVVPPKKVIFKVREKKKPLPRSPIWLFEALLKRPVLWVRPVSMDSIRSFMWGVCAGGDERFEAQRKRFGRFLESIRGRFGYTEGDTSVDWADIIRLESEDEDSAIELLRQLWNDFKAGKLNRMVSYAFVLRHDQVPEIKTVDGIHSATLRIKNTEKVSRQDKNH